ncbi:MAG: hypothetical protein R3C04_09295 [Hyphomonas sp.]
MAKGAIAPPSLGDKGTLWWFRNGALTILLASFLRRVFLVPRFKLPRKSGKDPPKPPLFPLRRPPEAIRRPQRITCIIEACVDIRR